MIICLLRPRRCLFQCRSPIKRFLSSFDGKNKDSEDPVKKDADESTSDRNSESIPKSDSSSNDDKREAAKKKLFSLLSEMKVESSQKNTARPLNLARAVKRVPKSERFKDILEEKASKSDEVKLQTAAKDVAASVKGDPEKTLEELNEKLRALNLAKTQKQPEIEEVITEEVMKEDIVLDENVAKTLMSSVEEVASTVTGSSAPIKSELTERLLRLSTEGKLTADSSKSIDQLLKGIKVESSASVQEGFGFEGQETALEKPKIHREKRAEYGAKQKALQAAQIRPLKKKSYDIFNASPLNVFQILEQPSPKMPPMSMWQKLEAKQLKLLVQYAPTSGFEEMIMWTEQGKHWKFPIDNEAEMGGEENVGFHEHVFLERHLHGFPTKGPVRHFMELVCVGLSKNPYITVDRKIENIDWFRDYFKEKENILRETGALG